MPPQLRIARPVRNLALTTDLYCRGLGLSILGRFENHDGFDGVMLGDPASGYHFEFTVCHSHRVLPSPTAEDLVVLYLPVEREWQLRCAAMLDAGFTQVASFNPYWETRGRTFVDPDGYRTVLQRSAWPGPEGVTSRG